MYLDFVGRESFYSYLAREGESLFPDTVFSKWYTADNGRPCVSPCLLTKVLLLQMYDGCSDAEAVDRAAYDLRWKVALRVGPEQRPFVKSTLQLHRARVHLNGWAQELLTKTVQEACRVGLIKGTKITVVTDTTPVFGRGAVKDTFNLIADAIKNLCVALGNLESRSGEQWATEHDLGRYWSAGSLKGDADIDWSSERERNVFLSGLVADADRVILTAENTISRLSQAGEATKTVVVQEAVDLLRTIVVQDVERIPAKSTGDELDVTKTTPPTKSTPPTKTAAPAETTPPAKTAAPAETTPPAKTAAPAETTPPAKTAPPAETTPPAKTAPPAETTPSEQGHRDDSTTTRGESSEEPTCKIKDGVAPDRVISVTDQEMRHGRKSASNRFDGHKAAIAVEPNGQIITAVDVIPGNAADATNVLNLVAMTEMATGARVEKTIGDCAYGDGATRQAFADAERQLIAKVPSPPKDEYFHKAHFEIDLVNNRVTCPAGHTTTEWEFASAQATKGRPNAAIVKHFKFPANLCGNCPFVGECVKSKKGAGRIVTLHPQENLLQEARQYQDTDAFLEDKRLRQASEHRLARLVQLGIRQARYIGRAKTKLQVLLAAAVANLVRIARVGGRVYGALVAFLGALTIAVLLAGHLRRTERLLASDGLGKMGGSRPHS